MITENRSGGPVFNCQSSVGWPSFMLSKTRDFAVLPDGRTIVAATSGDGLHYSNDGGQSWERLVVGGLPSFVMSLYMDAPDHSRYAATDEGIFQSTDNGQTWLPMNAGLLNMTVTSILADGQSELLVGTFGGVFWYSEDEGRWQAMNSGFSEAESVELIGSTGETLFAEVSNRGVFRSDDGGHHWYPLPFNQLELDLPDSSARVRVLRLNTLYEPQTVSIEGDRAILYAWGGTSTLLRAEIALPAIYRAPLPYLEMVLMTRQILDSMQADYPFMLVMLGIVFVGIPLIYLRIFRSSKTPLSTVIRLLFSNPMLLLSAANYPGYKKRWLEGSTLEKLVVLTKSREAKFSFGGLADQLCRMGVAFTEPQLHGALAALEQRGMVVTVKPEAYTLSDNTFSVTHVIEDLIRSAKLDNRSIREVFVGLRERGLPVITEPGYFWVDPSLARILVKEVLSKERTKLIAQTHEEHSLFVDTRLFFGKAGFRVSLIDGSLVYRCEPLDPTLPSVLSPEVYLRVLAGEALDSHSALQIRDEVHSRSPQARIVFLATDQRPTNQGWAQIGTLRMGDFIVVSLDSSLLGEGLRTGRTRQLLLDELEKRLGSNYDPYDVRDPVASSFGFFGRDPLIENLLRRLNEGQSVGVFGLRKLGKSSVLRVLANRVPFPVAQVNLQTIGIVGGLSDLYARIFRYWQQTLSSSHYKVEWDAPSLDRGDATAIFASAAMDLLNRLDASEGDARLGVFLDEAELIVPLADGSGPNRERYLTFMRGLRGLIDEDGRFSLVVASLNPSLNRINAWNGEQNPVFSLFQEIYLPPLESEHVVQMVRNIGQQVGLVYDDDSVQIIADLCGGHPFLARQLCSVLYSQRFRKPGEITMDALPAAVEHFIYDSQTVATLDAGIWQDAGNTSLWGNKQARVNQEILLDLAKADEPLSGKRLLNTSDVDARRAALIDLERFHFIHQPLPGYYALRYDLLRIWLRHRRLGLE